MAVVDTLVAAAGARERYELRFSRLATAASAAYGFQSMWQSAGIGGSASSLPTNGGANGRACSSSTAGALLFPTPPSSKHWFLHAPQICAVGGSGHYMLFDKLADVQVNHAANEAITGCDATARLASGKGGMIMSEVVTNFSAASNVFNLTYTDQDGNSSTTPNITTQASITSGGAVSTFYLFLPLAAGDKGARTITAINNVSGAATGTMLLSIVRPVFEFTIGSRLAELERDLFLEFPQGVKIDDAACLFFGGSASSSFTHHLAGSLGLVAL